jgi:hypothetical protein
MGRESATGLQQLDLGEVEIGEFHQEAIGAAAVVLEVDVLEGFGDDGLELRFASASCLGRRRGAAY